MNWVYQVLSFFVAFGPVILGTLLWHILWNDDSDSSNPPAAMNGVPFRPRHHRSGIASPDGLSVIAGRGCRAQLFRASPDATAAFHLA